MNLFLDTSALIKKYISENGSERVDDFLGKADRVLLSVITEMEIHSVFKRLLVEIYFIWYIYRNHNLQENL